MCRVGLSDEGVERQKGHWGHALVLQVLHRPTGSGLVAAHNGVKVARHRHSKGKLVLAARHTPKVGEAPVDARDGALELADGLCGAPVPVRFLPVSLGLGEAGLGYLLSYYSAAKGMAPDGLQSSITGEYLEKIALRCVRGRDSSYIPR